MYNGNTHAREMATLNFPHQVLTAATTVVLTIHEHSWACTWVWHLH